MQNYIEKAKREERMARTITDPPSFHFGEASGWRGRKTGSKEARKLRSQESKEAGKRRSGRKKRIANLRFEI